MSAQLHESATSTETFWAIRLPNRKLFTGDAQLRSALAGSAFTLETTEGSVRAWTSKADAKIRFGQLRETADAVGTVEEFDERAELVQFEAVTSVYEVDSIRHPLADGREVSS